MTPEQMQQARKLLQWSTQHLSRLLDIPTVALHLYENTGHMPAPLYAPRDIDRVAVVRNALETAGVEFIQEDGGGPGVRLRAGQ